MSVTARWLKTMVNEEVMNLHCIPGVPISVEWILTKGSEPEKNDDTNSNRKEARTDKTRKCFLGQRRKERLDRINDSSSMGSGLTLFELDPSVKLTNVGVIFFGDG